MNLKSTIVGFFLLLILQIKLITSQELVEYGSGTGPVDLTTIESTEASYPLPEEDKSTNLPATESTYPITIEVEATTETTEVTSTYAKSARKLGDPVTSITPKSFTSSPCNENSLEKLYSWSRNETSLNLFWFPSKTKFTHYIVSIEPPDSAEPIQIFKKKNIKFSDKVNVAFTDLHSSTFYNISLKKAYGAKILSETFMNWTTPPAQPLNLYVDESSITPKTERRGYYKLISSGLIYISLKRMTIHCIIWMILFVITDAV
ncbi:hypothetical protein HCN44_009674 [Aphidius gifuensis]|uniref:Fibronectin type-III domain-containing protein n=1 Tax=Aphidius gifuensis TaxID=684658 RepID=A0A834Y470_APHGI|nr:hypothetical protein HCN44_009674 [Aphidius gifuensis]